MLGGGIMKIRTVVILLLVAAAVSSGKVTLDVIEQILSVVSVIFIQTLKELLAIAVQYIQAFWP